MNSVKGEEIRGEGGTPAGLLERVFSHIATTRMADVPILNPGLRVEAVGFRLWQGRWVGVLVTPWTINLVMLPGEETLQSLGLDEQQVWDFPSGAYVFMGLNEPELGICQMCPLISPVNEFATHEDAVAVASEIAEVLFSATRMEQTRDEQIVDMIEEARLKGESLARKPVSRRDFLRAPFLGR